MDRCQKIKPGILIFSRHWIAVKYQKLIALCFTSLFNFSHLHLNYVSKSLSPSNICPQKNLSKDINVSCLPTKNVTREVVGRVSFLLIFMFFESWHEHTNIFIQMWKYLLLLQEWTIFLVERVHQWKSNVFMEGCQEIKRKVLWWCVAKLEEIWIGVATWLDCVLEECGFES